MLAPNYSAAWVASLPESERQAWVTDLPQDLARALLADWRFWARLEQLAPGTAPQARSLRGSPRLPDLLRMGPIPEPEEVAPDSWSFWLYLAGRGSGKTRSGAEFAIEKARALPLSHGALVAATADDARKTMLSSGLERMPGASGILAISPPDFRPVYESSKRILTWPNGTVATLYTAEEPDRLRGPQHHWGWVDEIVAWAKEADAWNQFLFGLRLGDRPQACVTTTPRPVEILRSLLRNPQTVVSRGRTRDNMANLAPSFLREIVGKYEGTRLGRQELDAELLDDAPGALWTLDMIDKLRVERAPQLRRTVTAIDPAVSSGEESDETGIVTAGIGPCSCKGTEELHGFVLADDSGRHTPNTWANRAAAAFRLHDSDRVVAEVNNGGALVEVNLRLAAPAIPYRAVRAAQGKRTRAEPIAALYEQGKVHHVGHFRLLEDQLCTWEPVHSARSPDRLDALVWAMSDLMLEPETTAELYQRTEW